MILDTVVSSHTADLLAVPAGGKSGSHSQVDLCTASSSVAALTVPRIDFVHSYSCLGHLIVGLLQHGTVLQGHNPCRNGQVIVGP